MIKSISFIVLTTFFHFNELTILRQPGYLFFNLNQQYFFTLFCFSIFGFILPLQFTILVAIVIGVILTRDS